MITSPRRTRLAGATVGCGLTLALALSGCGSSTEPAGGSASEAVTTATAEPASTTSPSASATSAAPSTSPDDESAGSTTPLEDLLLTKRDLPAEYTTGATNEVDASRLNTAVRSCVGVEPTTGGVVVRKTSPSFSYQTSGVASTVASYKTQAAVTKDAAVLNAPNAEDCFESAVINEFSQQGTKATSVTSEVRPGTNDGPANEAGVVTVSFVVDEDGRGSRQTISIGLFYLTGPKVLSQLLFIGIGNEFDGELLTNVLTTIAERTAQG